MMKNKTSSKPKYNNRKCVYNGIKFDSKVEMEYYIYLLENKNRLNIHTIETHKKFILQDSFKLDGKTIRAITYEADFFITYKDMRTEAVDIKGGLLTNEFNLKKKMFRFKYRESIPLKIIAKRGGVWVDFEDYNKSLKSSK